MQLTIHAFKGITGNIGAQRLYFLLLNIEKDLKNDNLSSDWIEKLRNEYKILSNEIKKYRK